MPTIKTSFPALLGLCLCIIIAAQSLGPRLAKAANEPNGVFSATTAGTAARPNLTGDNTYARIQSTRNTFTYGNGTLTLTGNLNGELVVSPRPGSFRFNVSSNAGNANLVLQKGTFNGNIGLSGTANVSTLLAGPGSGTGTLPTVTVTGALNGSNTASSRIQTSGANLVINGYVGNSAYIGEVRAWNGNINMTQTSQQNQLGLVSVASGMSVNSRTLLVIHDLDLQNNATVSSDSEIHVNGAIGRTANRMRPGSLLTARGSLYFLDPQGTQTSGIANASGTIRAGTDIGIYNSSISTPDLLQGDGHLRLEAGRDIGGGNITADTVIAGRNLIAGTDRSSASELGIAGSAFSLTPNKTLSGTNISAPLIAAGEIRDIADAASPSRVQAGQIMAVKSPAAGSSGDFTLSNGSFSFTGTDPIGASGYDAGGAIVSHSEASWIGGNMDVSNSGASSFTSLGVGGNVRIGGGRLSGNTLNAPDVTLHNGISAAIANLNLASRESGSLRIGAPGDMAGATSVSIGNLRLNGRDLLVGADGGQAKGAVRNFVGQSGEDNLVDGNMTVGHNGLLAIGAGSPLGLQAIAASAGMRADSAVLGVFRPVTLGGSLNVDAGWGHPRGRAAMPAAPAATVNFSRNSLLVIDGATPGVNYENPSVPTSALPATVPGAISSATPVAANVQGGAKIYINHVTPGHTYVALGRNITTSYADASAWSGANLISNNPMLELTRLGNGMEGQFSVTEKAPHATTMAAIGGVPRMARAASESMESAIYYRIKLGEEDLYRRSFSLWALPLYESIQHFGLDGGNGSYGYQGGIGGLAIGGDYTWQNILRFGISLNMGAGYVKSTGEAASTQNSASFWGAGAYGVWRPCDFSLDADVNVTSVYNRMRQDLPPGMGASEVTADIQAWSLGAGLRAQYEIVTRYVTMRPHAGVRYFHLEAAPYDVSMNGEDVIHGKRMYQNVWTFPVGIVFTRDIKLGNGWEITPLVNLKAIPASGDTYVKNSVLYADSHRDLEMENQVMDDVTWGGRAGVEFRAGDFTTAINYVAQFGSHTSNQGIFGVLRYEF